MNVADIISRVRGQAGDTDVLQFTNPQVIQWINDGMRECAIENSLLQKSISQAATVGVDEYALPADIAKLHSVKFNNQKLPILTLEEFDERYTSDGTDSGVPQNAVIWAGKVRLWPKPDTTDVIKIDYIATPTEVAGDADVPEIPVGYHRRLVDYCLAMVAEQDDDLNRYAVKMDEFRSGNANLKDDGYMEQDVYPSISVDVRDMGNGYLDGYE